MVYRLALLVLLSSFMWAQGLQPPDCMKAIGLHRAGQFEEAITGYKACLSGQPGNVEARSNLGAALAHLGRYEEAIEQYRIALQSAPPAAASPILLNLGLSYYKSGQISAAASEFSKLHDARPEDKNPALLLADCYLLSGSPEKAADILIPLEAGNTGDRALNYLLGTALLRGGRLEQGQAVLDRILRNGDSAEGHFLLGTGMFQARDFPQAAREFTKAIALDPQLPSLHSYYGQAVLQMGDPDGASEAFRQELAINPNDFESNLRLAQILLVRQKYGEARPLLERAIRIRPASEEAHQSLAEALGHRKRPAEAVDGLHPGDVAPAFSLPRLGSSERIGLSQYRAKSPVLLVFASYTCPQFRGRAADLNRLYTQYGTKIPFLLVYIREAHAPDNWQSSINERAGIALPVAATLTQKQDHALLCRRKLNVKYPAVVDGMDGKVESAYTAWPSRVYLIGIDGRVAYQTRLGELDFYTGELAAALEQTISK